MNETLEQSQLSDLPEPKTLEDAIRERNAWYQSAREFSGNADYYRGQLEKIGHLLGPEAHLCDDGSVSEDVLIAKLPELVKDLLAHPDRPGSMNG